MIMALDTDHSKYHGGSRNSLSDITPDKKHGKVKYNEFLKQGEIRDRSALF